MAGVKTATDDEAWWRDPVLWTLVGAGLVLRAGFSVATDPLNRLLADDLLYVRQALEWRETGILETGPLERPPAYFAFLYITSYLTGTGPAWHLTAKLVQSLAGAATAIPVYALAARASGRLAGRVGAAFLAFDPTLVAYAGMLWPETLFLFLTTWVFWRTSLLAPEQVARPIVLGLLVGLAMLLKPAIGLFTVLLALSWLRRFGWRGAVRLSLLFGMATALVLAPWVVRNQLRYGPEILLENEGPYNLWMGSHQGEPREVFEAWHRLPDPVTRARVASEEGWRGIAEHPGAYLRRSAARALNLWGLEWFILRNLALEGWGELGVRAYRGWFWLLQISYAVLLCAAALGLRGSWRDSHLRLLLLWTLVFTLLVAGLVATTRFRMPLHAILAILAGVGTTGAVRREVGALDLVPLLAAVGVLAWSFQRPLFELIAWGDLRDLSQLRRSRWVFFSY